jgi:sialic acid synthase SpsE
MAQFSCLYHSAFLEKLIENKTQEMCLVPALGAAVQSDEWTLKTLKKRCEEEAIFQPNNNNYTATQTDYILSSLKDISAAFSNI